LLTRIAEKPDLTLARWWPNSRSAARRRVTAQCGASSSAKGSVLKKSLHASEQDRADIARRRAQWKKYQGRLDPKRLVFIDETWAKTNMTRRHGRSPRGTRLIAKVPHGRWRTLTFWRHCDKCSALRIPARACRSPKRTDCLASWCLLSTRLLTKAEW
jgi:hypothetical protein